MVDTKSPTSETQAAIPATEITAPRKIRLAAIHADERAQPRTLSPDLVAEYAEDMRRGDKFPPPIVFQDKSNACWLADGFHRYHAAVSLELETIECEVRQGELRDAVLYSCGANAAHGMRRTNDNKRQAVTKLLKDEEWSHWSDREIARQCRVSEHTVAKLRTELAPVTAQTRSEERTYRNKHGTTSKIRTDTRGRRQPTTKPQPVAPPTATVKAAARGAVLPGDVGPMVPAPAGDTPSEPTVPSTAIEDHDAQSVPKADDTAPTEDTTTPPAIDTTTLAAESAEPKIEDEIDLPDRHDVVGQFRVLLAFTRFVVERATVRTDATDHPEFKRLVSQVKATLEAQVAIERQLDDLLAAVDAMVPAATRH